MRRTFAVLAASIIVGSAATTATASPQAMPAPCTQMLGALPSTGSGPVPAGALRDSIAACGAALAAESPDGPPGTGPHILDPIICPVWRSLAGQYSAVVIDSTGDVWVNTGVLGWIHVWDCPPYDA